MNPETEFREGLDELAEHYTEVLKLLGESSEDKELCTCHALSCQD